MGFLHPLAQPMFLQTATAPSLNIVEEHCIMAKSMVMAFLIVLVPLTHPCHHTVHLQMVAAHFPTNKTTVRTLPREKSCHQQPMTMELHRVLCPPPMQRTINCLLFLVKLSQMTTARSSLFITNVLPPIHLMRHVVCFVVDMVDLMPMSASQQWMVIARTVTMVLRCAQRIFAVKWSVLLTVVVALTVDSESSCAYTNSLMAPVSSSSFATNGIISIIMIAMRTPSMTAMHRGWIRLSNSLWLSSQRNVSK